MADEDDATFYVGALRCRAQASWLVKIGVRQLPTALQTSVKMRVGEDREQAVRRYVQENNFAAAAALIGAARGAPLLATIIPSLCCGECVDRVALLSVHTRMHSLSCTASALLSAL